MPVRDKILIQHAYEKGFNDCYVTVREECEKLQKENKQAKELIRELLYCTDGITEIGIPEENRTLHVKRLKTKAEAVIKE